MHNNNPQCFAYLQHSQPEPAVSAHASRCPLFPARKVCLCEVNEGRKRGEGGGGGGPNTVQFLISISLLQSGGAAAEELRSWRFDWQLVHHQGRGERRLGSGVDEPGWRWVNAAWRGRGLRRRQQRQLEKGAWHPRACRYSDLSWRCWASWVPWSPLCCPTGRSARMWAPTSSRRFPRCRVCGWTAHGTAQACSAAHLSILCSHYLRTCRLPAPLWCSAAYWLPWASVLHPWD